MKLLRISEDDLYDVDDYCPYWKGEKFTGIGYEKGTNGVIYRETSYKNGVRDGIYQEFTETGVLLTKSYLKNGYGYGACKKWDELGNLREVSIYSDWGESHTHKWDEAGNLIYKKKCASLGTRIINKYSKEQFFFLNGSLKEEKIYEYEIIKASKVWDKHGDLIQIYNLAIENSSYKYWLQYSQKSTSTNPFSFSK